MKSYIIFLSVLIVALYQVKAQNDELKICAFKIRVFGRSKASKPEVMADIVKIVRRCDIMLIQDIRDSSGEAIVQLLDEVNAVGAPLYKMNISARLGRTSSKMQYAFLYRQNAGISVSQIYQYPDLQDVFYREPYSVKFAVAGLKVDEIVLVALQARPDDAPAEINAMDGVHATVQAQMGTGNILILGDFVADCTYVTPTEMAGLSLRNDPKYHWLIQDSEDTTSTTTNCAYDRFVLTGGAFLNTVVSGSASVFRYDIAYNLTLTQALAVSDHYPIEMKIHICTSEAQTYCTNVCQP